MLFCLLRKAPNVRLGQVGGIERLGLLRGHNRDQFRCRLFGRSGGRLPAFTPPGPLIIGQVAVPPRRIRCLFWIRPNWNRPAQITDEGYRAGRRGSSGWSSRGKLMRAGATSRMTCPWISLLKGTKAPTEDIEERSQY